MKPGIAYLRLVLAALLCGWSALSSAEIPSGTMVFEFGAGNIYDLSQFQDCDTDSGGGFSLTICLNVEMVPNGRGKHSGTASFELSGNLVKGKLSGPASGSVSGKIGARGEAGLKLSTSGKTTLPDFPEVGRLKTEINMICSGKIDVSGNHRTVCKGELILRAFGEVAKERVKQRFNSQLNGTAWALAIDVNPVSPKKFTGSGTDNLGYRYKVAGKYSIENDTSEVEAAGKGSGKGAIVKLKGLTDTGAAKAKVNVQGYKGSADVQDVPPI